MGNSLKIDMPKNVSGFFCLFFVVGFFFVVFLFDFCFTAYCA